MLNELGYRVLRAKDAESALVIIESGAPVDLLVTDVVMPGKLKSTELARRARQRLPNLQVVFTSGYTENAIVHGGRLDENVELISKPYTREALARKLRHALANAAQRKMGLARRSTGVARPGTPARASSILVCEDDEIIRMSTVETLRALGHIVAEAGSGAAALALAERHDVNVLVTDVGLPDMSGVELADRLRARMPGLKVVFTTGRDQIDGVVPGPSVRLLTKPYLFEDLAAIVAELRN